MKTPFRIGILAIVLISVVSAAFFFVHETRKKQARIKIGVAITLTGRSSTWGARARNGVMLAVEEINAKGGINGKRIELIIKDDKGDVETALAVDRELIDEGVVAIVGHYLSTLGVEAAKLVTQHGVLMVSPACLSTALSGLDDDFIRVTVATDKYGEHFGDIAKNRLHCETMVLIKDLSNPAYTVSFCDGVRKGFEAIGGRVIGEVIFNSINDFSAPGIAAEADQYGADCVAIAANGIRAALICQHLRNKNRTVKFLPCDWAFSDEDFIKNGGTAIEGTYSIIGINEKSTNEEYMRFRDAYRERFNEQINAASVLGYESLLVLAEGLKKTDDPKKLKGEIINQGVFEGVDHQFRIDRFGDAQRAVFVCKVSGGKLVTVDTIELSPDGWEAD